MSALKRNVVLTGWGMLACLSVTSLAQDELIRVPAANDAAENRPIVLGYGKGLFRVGELLAKDDFENLENWVVQIQDRAAAQPTHVEARNNSMDCFLPGRGCRVWFKRKLKTRVAITYDVLCPTQNPAVEGLLPRDINNFWMATDPVDPDDGLFDSKRYDGNFSSYDKMHGYYASSGGRKNQTTRMRRYPRVVQGEPIDHIALNDKDEKPGFLITPNQAMSIQLVAFDDVIQYIVDGKLVYQMRRGERMQVEGRDSDGWTVMRSSECDLDRFPVYREGYFGFRMVGTHHVYTKFRVHALESE